MHLDQPGAQVEITERHAGVLGVGPAFACARRSAMGLRRPRERELDAHVAEGQVTVDQDAISVVAHAVDEETGKVARARSCPDHGEVLSWSHQLRAPVRVTYDAGVSVSHSRWRMMSDPTRADDIAAKSRRRGRTGLWS